MNDRGIMIRNNGVDEGRRTGINLIDSTYLTWTTTDDPGNREVEIEGTVDGAAVVEAGFPAPQRIEWVASDDLYDYMQLILGGGTQAQTPGQVRYHAHVEQHAESTYDAMVFGTGSSGLSGSLGKVAIYAPHPTTGRPDALLWSGNDVDISSSGVYPTLFASQGTWETAGAPYRDGSDRLVLTRGQMIWKAWVRAAVGSPTSRIISSARALGVDSAGAWSPLNGFSENVAYGSAFLDPPVSLVDYGGNVVFLPLRRVA